MKITNISSETLGLGNRGGILKPGESIDNVPDYWMLEKVDAANPSAKKSIFRVLLDSGKITVSDYDLDIDSYLIQPEPETIALTTELEDIKRAHWVMGSTTLDVLSPTTTFDVSSQMSAKSNAGSPTSDGVIVVPPYNKVNIRYTSNHDTVFDGMGQIYARLTESSGVWILTFKVFNSGTESTISIPANEYDWFFPEVFNLITEPFIASDAPLFNDDSGPILPAATEALYGIVRLAVDGEVDGTDVVQSTDSRLHTHANQSILDDIEDAFLLVDRTKLDGIEPLAEVNDISDIDAADLLARVHDQIHGLNSSDHTGTLPEVKVDFDGTAGHDHSGGIEGKPVSHTNITNVGPDDHHTEDHAARHEDGGADEINVAGLSGLLADEQNPLDHGTEHTEFSTDPVPNATITEGGLMSALDKAKLDGVEPFATADQTGDEIVIEINDPGTDPQQIIQDRIEDLDKKQFVLGSASATKGDAVYQDSTDGKVYLADASAHSTSFQTIGVVDDVTVTVGNPIFIRYAGILPSAFTGFTVGGTVWLSLVGTSGNTLTQTPPTVDNEVQVIVGRAISSTDLMVDVEIPLEL